MDTSRAVSTSETPWKSGRETRRETNWWYILHEVGTTSSAESHQGIFQRNLKSLKEFEKAALRNEIGRQSELRDESQVRPWWEVCGRIPYIWFLVMSSSSGFSTVTRLPDP